MRTLILITISLFFLLSCSGKEETGDIIISKVKYKGKSKIIDTLWVSQNDSLVFAREEGYTTRPCSDPEFTIWYNLKKPVENAYYYIYNPKGQLLQEGKYTYMDINGKREGNFYQSKEYTYHKNDKISSIYISRPDEGYKLELYDRHGLLKEITYYEKGSNEKEKVEIYKDGKLKETHINFWFEKYDVVKAGYDY